MLSKKKIRICFVMQYLSVGGIETRMLKLLNNLDWDRFDPVLLCIEDTGLQGEAFKATGVRILTTKGLKPVNRLSQLVEFFRLMRTLGWHRFDVIMSFMPTSHPFENLMARFAVKQGGFAYALVANDKMGRGRDWEKRERLARRVISVAKHTADYFYAGSPARDKVQVIYNGVDVSLYENGRYQVTRSDYELPENTLLFAYVARVAQNKGHATLLEALTLLKEKNLNIHVAIAGQDKMDGWLQNTIDERGLQEYVTYIGPVFDVPKFLSVCDGFLLASEIEGCPNALIEAMATGLPAIVTRSGAEELIAEGESGFSVEIGDSYGLAQRIEQLSSNPVLREKMGLRSRELVAERHRIGQMLTDYYSLFQELALRDTG